MTADPAGQSGGDLRRGRRLVLGTVVENLPNLLYRLRLEDGTERLAHVAGDLRMACTRLVPGDVVEIELSPLDPGKARIAGRAGKPSR